MDIEDNWPYDTITPHEDEAVYDILIALETQLDRLDVQLDELYEQRYLQTATTYELSKLAAEVGVQRQTSENDDRLRFRARIRKAVTRSDGTIDDIGAILHVIFGEDARRIDVAAATDAPVVVLNIPSILIEECPLTQNELAAELRSIIPSGDSLQIVTDETFRLGESGDQGLGSGKLA